MFLSLIKPYIPKNINYHNLYISIYTALTILLFIVYGIIYFRVTKKDTGEKYIPIIVTVRTIILSSFLIYFYNPLRSKFDYGHALPIFATAAGVALLLTLSRFDIMNLVHFCLYGKVLPPQSNPECKVDNENRSGQDIQIPPTV